VVWNFRKEGLLQEKMEIREKEMMTPSDPMTIRYPVEAARNVEDGVVAEEPDVQRHQLREIQAKTYPESV
jgi:hypothetical protein